MQFEKALTLTVFAIAFILSMTLTIPGWTGIAFIATIASGTKFVLDQWGDEIIKAIRNPENDRL